MPDALHTKKNKLAGVSCPLRDRTFSPRPIAALAVASTIGAAMPTGRWGRFPLLLRPPASEPEAGR